MAGGVALVAEVALRVGRSQLRQRQMLTHGRRRWCYCEAEEVTVEEVARPHYSRGVRCRSQSKQQVPKQ